MTGLEIQLEEREDNASDQRFQERQWPNLEEKELASKLPLLVYDILFRGLFFNYYLKRIVLNNNTVDFANMDLSPFLNNRYKKDFLAKVYSAKKVVDITKFLSIVEKGGEYRVEYKDMVQYTDIAKTLKIMGDTKVSK